MRLLITGGLGFIGSNWILHRKQIHPEDVITILDKGSYAASMENLLPLRPPKDFFLHMGDIKDLYFMGKVWGIPSSIGEYDYIVHFAAESHVDNSIKNAGPFLYSNIIGTANIVKFALETQTPIIHVSTDEVLSHLDPPDMWKKQDFDGNFNNVRRPENFKEFNPSSPYSASKAAGEMLVNAWRETFNVKATIVRSTNVYGPRQHKEKAIPTWIRSALQDKKIPLYGKGVNWRDWIYVKDYCRAFDLIVDSPPGSADGESIFHISQNDERQNIDVVRLILKELGKSEDLIEYVEDRPAHDLSYSLGSQRLRSMGWKPEYTLETGIKETIEWYKQKLTESLSPSQK